MIVFLSKNRHSKSPSSSVSSCNFIASENVCPVASVNITVVGDQDVGHFVERGKESVDNLFKADLAERGTKFRCSRLDIAYCRLPEIVDVVPETNVTILMKLPVFLLGLFIPQVSRN